MSNKVLAYSALCLLCLCFAAGSRVPEKPPLESAQEHKNLQTQMHMSSSEFTNQYDIPIVNPTTPTTMPTTPIVTSSPPPPSTMTPTYTTPITGTPTTPTTTTPTTGGGSWCIAMATASETALQVALDYACGYGGADCSAIQQGGSCYNPNTLRDHASYAFNEYYRKNPVATSCVFGGTAQLTYTDPSSGTCRFAQSSSTPTSTTTPVTFPPPVLTPTITSPAPPDYSTPPGMTTILSPPTTVDGYEPTGSPNSAASISCSFIFALLVKTLLLIMIL